MKIDINIPIIIEFNDYHQINSLLDQLNLIFKKKLKAKELVSDNGYGYYAIFYFKIDKKYKSMVKEHNIINQAKYDDYE